MTAWAIDLGTTNTSVARWDADTGAPCLLVLPGICGVTSGSEPTSMDQHVPSATLVVDVKNPWQRLGRQGWLSRRAFLGRWAWIGQLAIEKSELQRHPAFAPSFKAQLGQAPLRTLARVGRRSVSAREVATCFVRELLAEIDRVAGERVRDVVLTSPVEAFEGYRMELSRIFTGLGCKRVRFVDEPVAAALGYGVGIQKRTTVLVVDFGGGTLHLALVALDRRQSEQGQAFVVAKASAPVGGNDVDRWITDAWCQHLEYDFSAEGDRVWYELALREACRVKEAVYFSGQATFWALAPEELRRFEARLSGEVAGYELTRQLLVELLEKNGLYQALSRLLVEIEQQSAREGQSLDQVDEVLMVGGSTLLPGVYSLFEQRFGRQRVRAFQPFEAVAQGAAAYAAGQLEQSDFIVHDYAVMTHDPDTHEPQYTTIVAAGTRVPTAPDHWKRQLVPTCPSGRPESMFKLVICELGQHNPAGQRLGWDQRGALHQLGKGRAGGEPAYVVKLNEASPTLGVLEPPHQPRDQKARLEVAFGVNAERWLVASVRDLHHGKLLLDHSPVVKLV